MASGEIPEGSSFVATVLGAGAGCWLMSICANRLSPSLRTWGENRQFFVFYPYK